MQGKTTHPVFFSVFYLLFFFLSIISAEAEIPSTSNPQLPRNETDKKEENTTGTLKRKISVAFVYVGATGDCGWTWAHNEGKKEVEKLPFVEKTAAAEMVPEGAEATRVITQFAEEKYDLIFTTSFGFMEPTIEVAKKYPDTVFMHCSGYKTARNVGTYFGRIHEPRYLNGIVAGKMTSKNKIGMVAAHPIPEVIRGINAFMLGVRSVNPEATLKVVWTNTWYDPPKEKAAAESLLDAGCDVIAQDQDSPAPQQAAQERGAYSIGYNSDMSRFAPKAHLTAAVWKWGGYYSKIAEEVASGTWKSREDWPGMKEGVVDISPIADFVPEDVKKLVMEKRQEIIDGKLDVFEGPVKDQKGTVRIPAGSRPSDRELLEMNWFVEGIEGIIPE